MSLSLSRRGIVGGNESRVLILANVITGKLPDRGTRFTRVQHVRALSLSKVHQANQIIMGAIVAVVLGDLRSVILAAGIYDRHFTPTVR